MKFSIATVVAFAAMALALPESLPVERRQNQNVPAVDASVPAMSDRFGNVIPFDATKVYQDATLRGL